MNNEKEIIEQLKKQVKLLEEQNAILKGQNVKQIKYPKDWKEAKEMADNYEFDERHLGFKLPIKIFDETYDAVIIGINHDDIGNGKKANVTWFVSTDIDIQMNLKETNKGGYDKSYAKRYIEDFLAKEVVFENDIELKLVYKSGCSSPCSFFLLSLNEYKEFSDLNQYNQKSKGTTYELFKKEDFKDYLINYWSWTRSPHSNNSTSAFCFVGSNGSWSSYYASYSYGVSFAFCQ